MSNIVKQSFPVSLTEAINMGKVMFESGLFADLKSASQAVVKIQAGAEIGIPPFAALTGIHIIQGKPCIGAGIMAARVKGSGKYDYKIIQQDEKGCSIDFYQGENKIGNSSFTIEDAKKAQTKNMDKHPRNMLFARAISNGVKWFTPDIFSGPVYTPEEMANDAVITEDIPHEDVWALTADLCNEAQELINNSTLDANGKITAMNTVANCKSSQEFGKIVARLRTLQLAS
jgi:hypothetical protein